ncbi:hypothetical protein CRT60_01110 [Azospirillum palustre]|uniref:Uncharacterized protein n=1 Tax=Azospirillum palustre TaxID=2044885 RepID=A0A2B8BMU0_9PROT|nr:hypothetical protein [Azospirillum palustre]PGH59261.1 hypothetical protein CRT60_01110 [Azospirillum palustre]
MTTTTLPEIQIKAVRIKAVLDPAALPRHLLIAEPAPQPDVTLTLRTTDGALLHAAIAGKKFRRCLKGLDAASDTIVLLEGRLGPDGTLVDAGLNPQAAPPKKDTAQVA